MVVGDGTLDGGDDPLESNDNNRHLSGGKAAPSIDKVESKADYTAEDFANNCQQTEQYSGEYNR